MGTDDDVRVGTLVLRAWVESDGEDGLRVRITRSVQGCTTEPISNASTSINEVCEVVRSWLEKLVTSG